MRRSRAAKQLYRTRDLRLCPGFGAAPGPPRGGGDTVWTRSRVVVAAPITIPDKHWFTESSELNSVHEATEPEEFDTVDVDLKSRTGQEEQTTGGVSVVHLARLGSGGVSVVHLARLGSGGVSVVHLARLGSGGVSVVHLARLGSGGVLMNLTFVEDVKASRQPVTAPGSMLKQAVAACTEIGRGRQLRAHPPPMISYAQHLLPLPLPLCRRKDHTMQRLTGISRPTRLCTTSTKCPGTAYCLCSIRGRSRLTRSQCCPSPWTRNPPSAPQNSLKTMWPAGPGWRRASGRRDQKGAQVQDALHLRLLQQGVPRQLPLAAARVLPHRHQDGFTAQEDTDGPHHGAAHIHCTSREQREPLVRHDRRWDPDHSHHVDVHGHEHHDPHAAPAAAECPQEAPKPVKKNHGCDMCGKAFRDVYHLNRHKLSHSDEKPFECPICQQRFKRKDRMTYHVRSHDGEFTSLTSALSVGRASPGRPDHLSCHVKHVHSSERPFKCQVTACTSAFATKDRLRSHMIRHEGKVTCNICGKMLSAAYITSLGDWQWNHSGPRKGELTVGEILNNSFQVLIDNSHKDANSVHNNSATTTPVTNSAAAITSAMNRGGNTSNPVTIAAQMNIATSTVNITSPVNLQHPVTITGPVNLASVNIPTTAHMNIAHPVAITTPMPMNITGPLNIAMRPMESMPFLSQVLPSSPPW
ncbi:hypothetical protein INR49_020486 [Caranx melampygus]|nr:hypothetical protein INR49_020486 [Caranx melampygus]